MTLEEFNKLVPTETQKLIKNVLPYIAYYQERNLAFHKTEDKTGNIYSKTFFLLLYALTKENNYNSLLAQYGFNRSLYAIPEYKIEKEIDENEAFSHLLCIIPKLCDSVYYTSLTPFDIILEALDKYDKECGKAIFKHVFDSENIAKAQKKIKEYNAEQKESERMIIEKKIYNQLPVSVISYLETASKAFYYLKSNNILNGNNKDLVPLSMLIAVFYYQDTFLYEKEKISEQKVIIKLLKEKNITPYDIYNAIHYTDKDVSSYESNISVINQYLIQYCKDLKKNSQEIRVADILEEVFDVQYTNSHIIERVLAENEISIDTLKDFKSQVMKKIEQAKEDYIKDYIDSLYQSLSRDPREFIEFTCKTYELILEKMKNNTHNKEILMNEDDADTLSLYIANCYYNGIVNKFFLEYGVTLEKVLKLLNITITEEEIRKVELNKILLVDRFKRFVKEGRNKNRAIEKIDIDDIIVNLCDREFNKSTIIEDIFEGITDDIDLDMDFYNQMNRILKENVEKIRNEQIENFFGTIEPEIINYMKNVAILDNFITLENPYLSENCKEFIALLLAARRFQNKDIAEFIKYLDIDIEDLLNENEINISNLKPKDDRIYIELIKEKYQKYIFAGINTGKKKEEITIKSILQNTFNKDLNSIALREKYKDVFEQFDEKYNAYKQSIAEQEQIKKMETFIYNYNSRMKYYIIHVLHIDSKIREYLKDNQSDKIKTNDDIALLSMILGIYTSNSSYWRFFKEKNIKIEDILNSCDIHIETEEFKYMEQSITQEEYKVFGEIYFKYFKQDNTRAKQEKCSDEQFLKRIFDKSKSESNAIEELCNMLNIGYDVLKLEFEHGKSQEEFMTIEDRIKILKEKSLEAIDISDIESVMNFGNFLNMHSKYIHDAMPKLALEDTNTTAITTINTITDGIYEEEQIEMPKQSFLTRFFKPQPIIEPKKRINYSKVDILKGEIATNISVLNQELLAYHKIRKYIEAYRQKNNAYFEAIQEAILKQEEELQGLDPSKDHDYAKFLEASSTLQVLKNKANRFQTTNQLMKQELFLINQAIVNHFITVNALETARDDLIPLIGAEYAIGEGRNTEKQALELSQNVVALFQSLLSRNIESTMSHLKMLENSILPADTFTQISSDVEGYLQNLNNSVLSIEEKKVEEDTISNENPHRLIRTKKDLI